MGFRGLGVLGFRGLGFRIFCIFGLRFLGYRPLTLNGGLCRTTRVWGLGFSGLGWVRWGPFELVIGRYYCSFPK